MTEPPNTEAALAMVREALVAPMPEGWGKDDPLAALDAIASELEARQAQIDALHAAQELLQRERSVATEWAAELAGKKRAAGEDCKKQALLLYQVNERAEAAEAELERQRETTQKWYDEAHQKRREARAVEAELEQIKKHYDGTGYTASWERASLKAELERLRNALHEGVREIADEALRELANRVEAAEWVRTKATQDRAEALDAVRVWKTAALQNQAELERLRETQARLENTVARHEASAFKWNMAATRLGSQVNELEESESQLQARLDRAVEALRVIVALERAANVAQNTARAALAEIEESGRGQATYVDPKVGGNPYPSEPPAPDPRLIKRLSADGTQIEESR